MASVLLTFLIALAQAEYRVHQLQITKIDPEKGETKREVLSSLDELQYPEYYPLQAGESIRYLDSWMCFKRTDYFEPPCPKPTPQVKPDPKSNSTPAATTPAEQT